jgi:hypothetical protein
VISRSFTRFLRPAFLLAQLGAIAFALWKVFSQEALWPHAVYLGLIYGLLALATHALTRRPVFSLAVVALAFYAILRISAAKLAYLRSPLQVDDALLLLLQGDIVTLLLDGYPGLVWLPVAGLLAAIGYGALALVLERPSGISRLRVGTAVAAILGLAVIVPGPGALSAAAADDARLIEGDRGYNLVSHFVGSLTRLGLRRPVMAASGTNWPPPDVVAASHAGPTTAAMRPPDIVLVLEESTFDPQALLPFCTPELCRRALFEPTADSVAMGPLRVHVTGGLSILSEFALFTGMPHTLFGGAGLRAPMTVLPRTHVALPRQLQRLGYRTIVVYPLEKGAFGASVAYSLYGFDEIREHPVIGNERRNYWALSDRDIFRFIEQVLREEDARADRPPLFIYALTVQQHGPHAAGHPGQPPRNERRTFAALDIEVNAKLNDYLSRLTQSDEAIAVLQAALKRRDRPWVLAHFGDHLPAFEGLMRDVPKRSPIAGVSGDYVTYYSVEAGGFDAAAPALARKPPALDIAFLGGLLLDIAGLPKDRYFAANTRLRQLCNGLFTECADSAMLNAYQRYVFDTLHVVDF